MRSPILRIAHLAFSLALASSMFAAADAAFEEHPTTIERTPNAPIELSKCKVNSPDVMGQLTAGANVYNRTGNFLESVSIRWTLYNHAGEQMGQGVHKYDFRDHIAPQDTTTVVESFDVTRSDGLNSLGHAACRLQAATFEGGRSWTYGRQWNGKLSAVPTSAPVARVEQGQTSPVQLPVTNVASSPRFRVFVNNAWNDTLNGTLFVHVAMTITGGDSDATLRPDMLALSMSLANGGKKSYPAMTQGAPTYQKLNPLGQTTQTAYEVDPKDDIGAIGSIIVPAHGTVHTVATFFVGGDILADPNANREVSIR